MKPAAVLSLLCYTVGLPASFLYIIIHHRSAIRADQSLRQRNLGQTVASNPQLHIRRRFQDLYAVFRAEYYYWRMVLTLRKFCEVAVALLFSSSPLFQAWCVPPLPL